MKDFMMKHPWISLLMLSEVTTMITNLAIAFGDSESDFRARSRLDNNTRVINKGIKKIERIIDDTKKKKVQCGFHL